MIKFNKKVQFIKIFDNEKHKYERIAYFFLAPLFLLFALEIMHLTYPGSLKDSFSVFFPLKLFMTYLFLLGTQSVFYTITFGNDFAANFINSIVFFLMAYINEVVAKITGDPLLPTDFLLIGQLKEISSFAKIPVYPSMIMTLAVVIYSLKYHKMICNRTDKLLKFNIKIPACIAAVVLFAFSSYYLCFDYDFRHRTLPKIGVTTRAFNPIEDYNANGLILTFFPRIGDAVIRVPDSYTEEAVNKVEKEYGDNVTPVDAEKVQPNVIIIQNEAFWDPTLLENVEFSSDPMPNIRRLSETYPSGYMFSPVFAGGTCMPEFECLTGMSTAFLDSFTYPYIQHVTSKTTSTASLYKDAGYSTVAIHPYNKNFYGRYTAYPLLGFDEFIGIEEMQNSEKRGWHVSDASAVDEMIYQYENKKTDRIFQFCVTIQNHGAYSGGRYPSYDVVIENSSLSKNDKAGLEDFTQGVFDADVEFNRLINYFVSESEPTLIVMYGDHLPLLGTEGSTYMDTGFIERKENFEYYKYPQLYKTPYIVWANYDISDFELPKLTSPANIGLSVLEYANIGMPWYMNLFKEVYEKYPVFQGEYIMNPEFEYLKGIDEKDRPLFDAYKLIQFDLLDGENYILK